MIKRRNGYNRNAFLLFKGYKRTLLKLTTKGKPQYFYIKKFLKKGKKNSQKRLLFPSRTKPLWFISFGLFNLKQELGSSVLNLHSQASENVQLKREVFKTKGFFVTSLC